MGMVNFLYKLARAANTANAVSSGKGGRRAKNIALGRALGKSTRKLWR